MYSFIKRIHLRFDPILALITWCYFPFEDLYLQFTNNRTYVVYSFISFFNSIVLLILQKQSTKPKDYFSRFSYFLPNNYFYNRTVTEFLN